MESLLKFFFIGVLFVGILFALISYNFLTNIELYKIKNQEGQSQKYFLINEKKAKEILNQYEVDSSVEDNEFDIINFIEKLNGDFNIYY